MLIKWKRPSIENEIDLIYKLETSCAFVDLHFTRVKNHASVLDLVNLLLALYAC